MIKTYLFNKETKEDVPLDDWKSLVSSGCALLWVDVRSFTNEELNDLAAKFGLHSIALESCTDPYRRPHMYEFSDHFYINFTVLKSDGDKLSDIQPSELHLFVGEKFIITITNEAESEAVDTAINEFKDTPGICERGPMYGVYLLSEGLVETYFPTVEDLDDEADALEAEMMDKADKGSLRKLFALKRRGFEIRKLLGPQRDIFNELSRRDFPFIKGENQVYFQDIYNRMIRIYDMMDTIREILSGNLDIYLSTVSNRLNEVMKVLTVAATILMTISFITGFYGMNIPNLPGMNSPHASTNVIIVMGAIILGMFWWFRRKGWL